MINILTGIESTSAALNAERVRMEVIAQNIANANTTRGIDGKPYQRQTVVFESVLRQQQSASATQSSPAKQVEVARIEKDPRPMRVVNIPGHKHADAQGNVLFPNVNIHEEMADMIAASRSYEANLAVVRTARLMALQALGIGKR
jgi:flagellar basal-body rod protein FlgC